MLKRPNHLFVSVLGPMCMFLGLRPLILYIADHRNEYEYLALAQISGKFITSKTQTLHRPSGIVQQWKD